MSLEASLRQADDCELEIVCHQGEYVPGGI
jgi:hypothetical protein